MTRRTPKKVLNFLVDDELFMKFKKLCAMNETTMTKVLMECVNKYVEVEMKVWVDKLNASKQNIK